MRKVFITGATGFLGSYILYELLKDDGITPVVLVRNRKDEPAQKRIANVLKYFYGNKYALFLDRIEIIEGEVDKIGFGADVESLERLTNEISDIYHSAAIAQFRVPLNTIRKSNVEGARNVFDFALECKRRGPIETVNHISTTYVAGTVKGLFFEKDLDLGQGFNNTYEQSKYEAELLVDDYRRKGINITVFRPSILTGGAIDGRTSNFKMLYQPLHFFSAELFDTAPINRDSQENLIPVDSTAMSIVALAGDTRLRNKTYHIANTSTIGIGHFIDVAADFFGFKAPEMIPVEEFNMGSLSTVQESLISPYVPYFNYTTKFGVEQSQKALRQKEISIPPVGDKFLEKLFRFCAKSGFIKIRKKSYVAAR